MEFKLKGKRFRFRITALSNVWSEGLDSFPEPQLHVYISTLVQLRRMEGVSSVSLCKLIEIFLYISGFLHPN